MTRYAFLAGALALAAGLAGPAAPARADEPALRAYRAPPAVHYRTVYRPRTVVRRVVVERPVPVYRTVYRTRRVVREVVVERPVFLRPRPVYREVFDDGFYGPPPYFGPPPFRPRPFLGYGFGPRPFPPFGPRPIGWGGGWGPGPFF